MDHYNRGIRKEELWRTSFWSLFLIFVVLEIAFVKEGTSQVDTSKAVIWSTTTLDGHGELTILYGDPQAYIADITAGPNQTNITSYSTAFVTDIDYTLGFGALDAGYKQSIIYFYFSQNIYFSTEYLTSGFSPLYYLPIVATSNQVTGFALDWVSGLLYWSDAGYQRICLIDTVSYRLWRSVVDTNITSPQDVVIYPHKSYLFWSDLGANPKIERLDLTNDQRKVLLSNGTLQTPTTLAIDFVNQRLFWLDSGRETIGSMKLDGSDISLWSLSIFSSLSSFVLYQDYIFFGDNAQSAIYIYNVTKRQYLANITASTDQRGTIDMTMWSSERQTSVPSPCNSLKGGCDQFCITVNATARRCMCAMGFFLAPNGSTCLTRPLATDRFLLMTDEEQGNTFQIDVETGEVRAVTFNEGMHPTAMDFDPIGKSFYWIDSRPTYRRIKKTALDNSYRGVFVDQFGNEITSLAVDTVSKNLYYADYGAGTIGQISLSTAKNKELLAQFGSIPRAIVLDINNRSMYWSDCGYSTIERGSISNPTINRQSIVNGLSGCVTSLAIDFEVRVIYWGYEFGGIERANLDGTSRTTIHQDYTATYTGLALDSRYLYLSDSNKRQIQRLDRNTNLVTNLTKNLFTKPYALLYYANYSTSTTGSLTKTETTSTPNIITPTATNTTPTQCTTPTTTTTATTTTETTTATTTTATIRPTTTFTTTSSSPSSVVPLTTVIVASVVSGAVVLVVVIVTVGIVLARKSRSKRPSVQHGQIYDTTIRPPSLYDTINDTSIQRGAMRPSPQVENQHGYSQAHDNLSERRNEPEIGPYDGNIEFVKSMIPMHQGCAPNTK